LHVRGIIPLPFLFIFSASLLIYGIHLIYGKSSVNTRRLIKIWAERIFRASTLALVLGYILTLNIGLLKLSQLAISGLFIASLLSCIVYTCLNRERLVAFITEAKFSDKLSFFDFSLIIFFCLLGFVLRVWNLDYIQGSDLFNLSAAKALFDNGNFLYERNEQLTYLIAEMFRLFSPTLFFARLPLALIGVFSIYLMYILGRYINPKIGLMAGFLLAISPVAIEESTMIREYSENLVISLIALILLFKLVKTRLENKVFVLFFAGLLSCIYTYSLLSQNYTSQLIILLLLCAGIPTFISHVSSQKSYLLYSVVALSFASIVLFAFYVQDLLTGFHLFGFEPYWFHSFFESSVKFPMQWFSLLPVPELVLVGFFLIPLIIFRNKFLYISYFTFFTFLAIFVFKFENTLSYVPTRYIYVLYPIYVLILATSIYACVSCFWRSKISRFITVSALAVIFINPTNIMHAANHDLVLNWPYEDKVQPTSTGTRNDVAEFLGLITENNLINTSDPMILTDFDPSWLLLKFNIDIDPDRFFSDKGNYRYNIGKNVYLENDYWQVYDLTRIVESNQKGIYITRSSRNFSADEKHQLAEFNLLATHAGFEIYSWYNPAFEPFDIF
jgi:hypothetical protein